MERIPVQSSNLATIGYDSETETLEITFLKSGIYEYRNVPQIIYDELMNSPSHGSYFSREIKNTYPCERIG